MTRYSILDHRSSFLLLLFVTSWFDPVCFWPNIFLNSIPEFISDLRVKLVGLFIGSENFAGVNAAVKARLRPDTIAGLS
jgi:hypothetical protein